MLFRPLHALALILTLFGTALPAGEENGVFRLPSGEMEPMRYSNTCYTVTNNHSQAAMVPHRTSNEWNTYAESFIRSAPHPNLKVEDCLSFTKPTDCPDISVCPRPHGNRSTIVTVILDGSGSMDPYRSIMVGAVNTFIRELKQAEADYPAATIRLNLAVFRDTQRGGTYWPYNAAVINASTPNFSMANYQPAGTTPLWTAMDEILGDVSQQASFFSGWRQVVVLMSDGAASDTSMATTGRSVVVSRQNSGWQFLYLGALNGISTAGHTNQANWMNIGDCRVVTFNSNADIYNKAFYASANNAARFAAGVRNVIGWDRIQEAVLGANTSC